MNRIYFSPSIFITLFLTCINMLAFAQKTENVQDKAIWANSPIKVDGKTSDDAFESTNKSTLLSYTMSNDDKNLYLVIKSTDNTNNNKIMMGGITLSINTDGKKKEKDGFSITYPVIARAQRQRGQGGFGQRTTDGSADSAMLARRKQQLAAAKEIKVLGFKDIQDSLISIYNEFDINAAANFDEKGAFVYELAIPLKLLGLTLASKEFAYNIKLNGLQFGGGGIRVQGGGGEGAQGGGGFGGGGQGGFGGGRQGGFGGGGGGSPRGGFDPSAFLPTDFWGKYTLAKK